MAGDAGQGGKPRTSAAAKKKAKKATEAPAQAEEAPAATLSPKLKAKAKVEGKAEVAAEAKKAMAEVVAEGEADDATGADKEAKAPKRKTKADRFAKALKADKDEMRGVVYLGHIPKGFFEPQMRKFFSQFGQLRRLRLSRSAKNAASKGYAFIEFQEESVAKIVAETMHNYLLFGKKLVCHLVDKEKQHPNLFKNCNKILANRQPARRRKAREVYNDRPLVEVNGVHLRQQTKKQVVKAKSRHNKLLSKLAALDIEYSLDSDEGTGAAKKPKDKAEQNAPTKKRSKGDEALTAAPKKKRKQA